MYPALFNEHRSNSIKLIQPIISRYMPREIESLIPGLLWPAMPSPIGAANLSLLYQLQKTQWWSKDTLENNQFRQLANVLSHAYGSIPFYRDVFNKAGINPKQIKNLEELRQIPLLTRQKVQKAEQELLSKDIPKSHGPTFESSTTGATGLLPYLPNT